MSKSAEAPEPCGLGPTDGIPSAELKYEFFTPYHRGHDLVFDFVRAQPDARFTQGPWSIAASYGYERSQDTKVYAEDRYVGTAHSISERFAQIAHVYRAFMAAVETAATEWMAAKRAAEKQKASLAHREDEALCERILAAATRKGDAHD